MKPLLLASALLAALACPALAQDEPPPYVHVQPRFGAGATVDYDEEGVAFSRNSVRAELDWYGVSLPMQSTTGLRLRIGYEGYSLWSITEVTLIPKRLYQQVAMKFGQVQQGTYDANYDLSTTTGLFLGKVGPVNLALETTFLDEDKPIYAGVKVRF